MTQASMARAAQSAMMRVAVSKHVRDMTLRESTWAGGCKMLMIHVSIFILACVLPTHDAAMVQASHLQESIREADLQSLDIPESDLRNVSPPDKSPVMFEELLDFASVLSAENTNPVNSTIHVAEQPEATDAWQQQVKADQTTNKWSKKNMIKRRLAESSPALSSPQAAAVSPWLLSVVFPQNVPVLNFSASRYGWDWGVPEAKVCIILVLLILARWLYQISKDWLVDFGMFDRIRDGAPILRRVHSKGVWTEVSLVHTAWLFPLVVLVFFHYVVFGAIDEADRQCDEHLWRPMISPIAKLYIHHFGNGLEVRKTLKQDFDELLFVNLLRLHPPEVILPTMKQTMNSEQLEERRRFFLPNYGAFISCFFLGLELVVVIAKVVYRLPSWIRPIVRFLMVIANAIQKLPTLFRPTGELKTSSSLDPLLSDSPQQPVSAAKPSEEKVSPESQLVPASPESKDPSESQPVPGFGRADKTGLKTKIYVVAFSIHYVMFQALLYVWVDVAVAGGMINTSSGADFELWSLGMEFEMVTHICVSLVTHLANPHMQHQHPALLVAPILMPIFGNVVHIMKDHLTQGLSFSVGRCAKSNTLSWVGVVLGYCGFAITLTSLARLLWTPECREGLRIAHWPVAEALPATTTSGGLKVRSADFYRKSLMNAIISSCTEEKEVRAVYGEVPHTVLHLIFIFFFGGSDFMWFSVFLSAIKIFSIPLLRELFIIPKVGKWGCSRDAAKTLMVNFGEKDDRIRQTVYTLAKQSGWGALLQEFFKTDYGYVEVKEFLKYDLNNSGPNGHFALNNNWKAMFYESKFYPENPEHLHGAEVKVLEKGKCEVPRWCRHGSTFHWEATENRWVETDHVSGKVLPWNRL